MIRFNDVEDSTKLNQVKDEIGQKIVSLVHEHLLPLKDKLIEKCKSEEITPTRALWLTFIPLTNEDILNLDSILNSIKNKYIRWEKKWSDRTISKKLWKSTR